MLEKKKSTRKFLIIMPLSISIKLRLRLCFKHSVFPTKKKKNKKHFITPIPIGLNKSFCFLLLFLLFNKISQFNKLKSLNAAVDTKDCIQDLQSL